MFTVLEGTDIGSTYKIEGNKYWAWDKEGKQFAGAVRGNLWDIMPEKGFEAAFHDGDKNDPTIVAFRGIYVRNKNIKVKTKIKILEIYWFLGLLLLNKRKDVDRR